MSNLPTISVTDLLDAGIHFGHKTSRWNPKMAPYIYGVRDGIHIIDLQQTQPLLQVALKQIYETVKNNGKVLFVGSKIQASALIAEYAEKCGQFYVNHRWLGGMLTNWGTISRSIKKLENLEKILQDEELIATYTKKEVLDISRRRAKLLKFFAGIRKINGKPDLIIVIDTNKEHLAISEAVKLGIPLVAIVDTNCDPDNINFPVPGNDDAIRSIRLFCNLFSDAALAGIRDALADAGADLGKAEEAGFGGKDLKNIKKFEKPGKVSKAKPAVISSPKATDSIGENKENQEQTVKNPNAKKSSERSIDNKATGKEVEKKELKATLKAGG